MTPHPFLPLAWLLPGFIRRWAEAVIYGACDGEDGACPAEDDAEVAS